MDNDATMTTKTECERNIVTVQPLRNSGQAQRYYAVLASTAAKDDLHSATLAATSTSPRWHGECRGLKDDVTEFEFQAVSCSRDVRAAFVFTFAPSLSISHTYDILLQQQDWLNAQLIIQSVENAANHAMQELFTALGSLVWAAGTRRWQRGERTGMCWTAVLFDISSAEGDVRRERHNFISSNAKDFSSASSKALTECLASAWPEREFSRVPQSAIDAFRIRRDEIEKAVLALDTTSAKRKAGLMAKTRAKKQKEIAP
jgi:hypothetical protein